MVKNKLPKYLKQKKHKANYAMANLHYPNKSIKLIRIGIQIK